MDKRFDEVIVTLNDRDRQRLPRKTHRLTHERYAQCDCEYFIMVCARQHGTPFLNATLAKKIIGAMLHCREQYR